MNKEEASLEKHIGGRLVKQLKKEQYSVANNVVLFDSIIHGTESKIARLEEEIHELEEQLKNAKNDLTELKSNQNNCKHESIEVYVREMPGPFFLGSYSDFFARCNTCGLFGRMPEEAVQIKCSWAKILDS